MFWNYQYLIIWWLVFFIVHSFLASSHLKKRISSRPILKSYYRLFFNLISTVLLIPIMIYYYSAPDEVFFKTNLVLQIIGSSLSFGGLYILIAGFKNYRADEFIGTYQMKNNHEFHPTSLIRTGWNGIVRHPLYFGGILFAIGLCLITPSVRLCITTLLVIGYLYLGTIWEEKKLKSEFGEVYSTYQKDVSMLIPLKWLLNKISRK
jgi:protein-S-isoprenylcysteine O-methyltransferase Ste14